MMNWEKPVCLDFIRITVHLLEGILRDSAYEFLDDINTPEKETLKQDVTLAFKQAAATCKKLDHEGHPHLG